MPHFASWRYIKIIQNKLMSVLTTARRASNAASWSYVRGTDFTLELVTPTLKRKLIQMVNRRLWCCHVAMRYSRPIYTSRKHYLPSKMKPNIDGASPISLSSRSPWQLTSSSPSREPSQYDGRTNRLLTILSLNFTSLTEFSNGYVPETFKGQAFYNIDILYNSYHLATLKGSLTDVSRCSLSLRKIPSFAINIQYLYMH